MKVNTLARPCMNTLRMFIFCLDNKFKAAEENAEFTKRCYLFAYSLSMFAGYGFVTIKLLYGIIAYGQEYLTSAYAPASE